MGKLGRITDVRVSGGRRVEIKLTDGRKKQLDLAPLLEGPVFEDIRQCDEVFAQVRAYPESGTLAWPGGADLCPDVLIDDLPPA